MKRFALFLITSFIFFACYAQSPSQFIGTWIYGDSNSSEGRIWKDMKIYQDGNDLFVKMKTINGIKQAKAQIENNKIFWYIITSIEPGQWFIHGTSNKPRNIREYRKDHGYTMLGEYSNCYGYSDYRSSSKADKKVSYIDFYGRLENDELKVYFRYGSDFLENGSKKFDKIGNWTYYHTYSNW